MLRLSQRWPWMLAAVALVACATAPPLTSEWPGCEVAAEAMSFDEACAQENSLAVVCAGDQCGLFSCHEIMGPLTVGRVVLARFPMGGLHNPQLGPLRHWGNLETQATAAAQSAGDAGGVEEGAAQAT